MTMAQREEAKAAAYRGYGKSIHAMAFVGRTAQSRGKSVESALEKFEVLSKFIGDLEFSGVNLPVEVIEKSIIEATDTWDSIPAAGVN